MSAPAGRAPALKEIETRFLYPFFFRQGSVAEAQQMLHGVTTRARGGELLQVWGSGRVHDLYKEELLAHVVKFLFSAEAIGCAYLRVPDAVGERWFGKTVARVSDGDAFRVRLVTPALVEMYLSSYGVGVLSIALKPDTPQGLELSRALEFNYRLSQLRPGTAALLHTPHPSEDPAVWERLTPQQRQDVTVAPDRSAHIFERIGRSGGSLHLGELVDELVRPLADLEFAREQGQFSVYTVARFGGGADFGDAAVRRSLAPFLSALAQVEEPKHAGAPEGEATVRQSVLNRSHWAGGGLLGIAHLVADQEPRDLPFNEARVTRVMLKYFIPYLAALMQRATLHRASQEAGDIVLAPSDDSHQRFVSLRRHLLEFAVKGHFTEVSAREAIHRYYRLCQEALDVPEALANTQRAVADIDARNTTDRQVRIAEDLRVNAEAARGMQERMNSHLALVAKMQSMIEWIEIFLVSVYCAHLWHMFASHVESLHHWVPHGVLISAALGGAAAALTLKPWRHRHHKFAELEEHGGSAGSARPPRG